MIKILATFIFLSVAFGFTLHTVRLMTGKEKWALTKTISYAILCALLAIAVMIFIVILF